MSNEVISRLISELKPHPRNYNNHSDRQVDDLALSLKKFGQRKPIVTWRNMIVAGHGLTMAAQMAGWTSILTMPIPDDWDEATVLAYLAADNELARQADPDLAQLAAIAKELEGIDEELAKLAAGGDDALKALMATIEDEKPNGDAEPQIDKAEELRQKWDVQSGQMWQLGEHRIVCGDCTDRAVVERVMGGEKADLAWFDPPFGINLKPQRQKTESIENDGKEDAQLLWCNFLPILKENMNLDTHLFLCQGWSEFDWTLPLVRKHFTIKSKVVWNKNVWGIGYYTRPKHEDILYCWYGEPPTIDVPVADVWDIARENAPIHAAEKPPKLSSIAIEHFSKKKNVVIDWFSGVGGTIIACENLSRKCRAVEISPAYVAVAIQRWVDVTGKEPILL